MALTTDALNPEKSEVRKAIALNLIESLTDKYIN